MVVVLERHNQWIKYRVFSQSRKFIARFLSKAEKRWRAPVVYGYYSRGEYLSFRKVCYRNLLLDSTSLSIRAGESEHSDG